MSYLRPLESVTLVNRKARRWSSGMPPMNCQRTSGIELGVLVDRPVDADEQARGFEIGQMLLQVEPRAAGLAMHGRRMRAGRAWLECLVRHWVDRSTTRIQAGCKMRMRSADQKTQERGNVSDRKDDPAFIYFPTNYRWSMGLLLCLSAAPWGGAEIDEVNRVGRALRDKVGDDNAWFEEWARMGDIVEARGRDAEKKGHTLTAAACLMRAAHYYQTGERFLQHGPRSAGDLQEGGEVVCRRRGDAEAAAHRIGGDSIRRQDAAGAVRASRAGGRRQQARAGAGVLRRLRHHQGDPILQGRA